MSDKEKLDGTPGDRRLPKLQVMLQNLTAGIVIDKEDLETKDIQEMQKQMIIENMGVLLLFAGQEREISSFWDIVQEHLPDSTRSDSAEMTRLQGLYSQPLSGTPTEIVSRLGLGKKGGLVYEIVQNLRSSMTQEQNSLLPSITGREI